MKTLVKPLVKPLACHIHTHINTLESFFLQIWGCFTRGALQKPFARGAFTRRAFTRKGFCKGPSEAPSDASSLPHTYTHMHIFGLFSYRYGGASQEGL